MATRAEQLADAYVAVAKANHYMVGIVDDKVTPDERDDAEQILIRRQHGLITKADFRRLELALDLLQQDRSL